MPSAMRSGEAAPPETLSVRRLNRALLARQHLLDRDRRHDPLGMVHHLGGLQAQNPLDPYYALWSRIAAFDPATLATLLTERQVARAPLLRTTIHLVTAADCLAWRPLTQALLERVFWSTPWGKQLRGIDVERLLADGHALLAATPRTGTQLAAALAPHWPEHDPAALAYAVRYMIPLVQIPPRGVWGDKGQATWTPMTTWLAAPLSPPDVVGLVRRHIAAFGPVSVMDTQNWSGLTRLGEIFDRLQPELRVFRAPSGIVLYDFPDAPRPEADTPAPPRFFPQFDNVFLGHDDRARIEPQGKNVLVLPGNPFSLDGFIAGFWKLVRERRRTVLRLTPLGPIAAGERDALWQEAAALLTFAAPDTDHDIQLDGST